MDFLSRSAISIAILCQRVASSDALGLLFQGYCSEEVNKLTFYGRLEVIGKFDGCVVDGVN